MFSEYKQFKESSHLRAAFAAMWKSLDFGTKSMQNRDSSCKPGWYDEDKFVPWDKFKGCQRPDNFNGNWAALQYDLIKAAYLHHMTAEDIEAYLPESRKVAPVQQSSVVVQLAPGVDHGITLQPDQIVQHYPGNPVLHDPVPQPGPSFLPLSVDQPEQVDNVVQPDREVQHDHVVLPQPAVESEYCLLPPPVEYSIQPIEIEALPPPPQFEPNTGGICVDFQPCGTLTSLDFDQLLSDTLNRNLSEAVGEDLIFNFSNDIPAPVAVAQSIDDDDAPLSTPDVCTGLPKPNFIEHSDSTINNTGPKTPDNNDIVTNVMNTPGSLKRKRSEHEVDDHEEEKKQMSGGWLGSIVENPSQPTFGLLQILGTKQYPIKDDFAQLVKASDGKYVTWHVAIEKSKLKNFLSLPMYSLIEVKAATMVQGYRLFIHDYDLVDDTLDDEICLEDELIFLEKDWYMEVFKKKGMVTETGNRNKEHDDFTATPITVMTRSRTAQAKKIRKETTGGFKCDICEKKFKTDKTLIIHKNKYHG